MHNFKKAIFAVLYIVLLLAILSEAIVLPFLHSEHGYYQDHKLRDSLAGTIDFIVIGSSNALEAADTRVIDQQLNCKSYNLSSGLMPIKARRFFLEKELDRNPVKTVILHLGYETLSLDEHEQYAVGHECAPGRLNRIEDRLKYLIECVDFDDWLNLYSRELVLSMGYWKGRLAGDPLNNVDYSLKGFYPRPSKDLTLSPDEARECYNGNPRDFNIREENMQEMQEMIQLCKEKNIRVILMTFPRPDAAIWPVPNLDQFHEDSKAFAEEQNCEYYDMNLFRKRFEILNEQTSFFDVQHMSEEGAAAATEAMCDILKCAEQSNVSGEFYGSYQEMKEDCPYMEYLDK